MQEKSDLRRGWEFAAHLAGANVAAQAGGAYVSQVEEAIGQLVKDINALKSNQTDADTFNVDAVAAGSAHRYNALGSTEYGSVDVRGNFPGAKDYSLKFMATGEDSAVAQAEYSRELGRPKYRGQERLIPTDQMDEAKYVAGRRAASNKTIRPEIADSYKETGEHFRDRIKDGKGIESKPLSKKDDLRMAKKVKKDQFDPEEFGENLNSAIKPKYVLKQALKAGYTAAAITVAMQLAPEIFKSIDYLIKTGEIDIQQVKKIGEKAITAGTEGFICGSISCSLLIMCEKGLFGEAFKGLNPTMLGAVVAIVVDTVKNSILVAAGKMTPKEMGAAFTDGIIISSGFLLCSKIGGVIGQAIGVELPVVGYLLGSLIGCAFAAAYNIGKKHLISFCVDTGFTCFGLVEQNYELPDEVLKEIGVETISVLRTEVPRTEIEKADVTADIERTKYETINITVLRRGVIGVNKVGYVFL
jgi:hypothetical protein